MKTLLLTFTLFVGLTVFGQSPDTTSTLFKHEVGFHVGSTSGYGPSYRLWYKKFGFQVSALPMTSISSTDKLLDLVVGVNLNYMVQENDHVDFYTFVNTSLNYYHYKSILYLPYENENRTYQNIGFGAGFDFKFLEVMTFSTQFGYGFYNITNSLNGDFTAGASLLYRL
ncbi:MAG: hypothetical protein ACWA41_00300 [Putridiphycobacter sp.]